MSKTVLVLPDQHAHKDHHNDRADWLGKLILDLKPDVLVNMGDAADMPSLSSYDKGKASFHGASYQKDIEAHLDFQERMWAPIKQAKRKKPHSIVLVGNHCVPADTDVLTRDRGWVNITEVTEQDIVLTLSGWEKVENTVSLDYKGDMYKFGDRSVTSCVTADHRVYYYSNGSDKVKISRADEAPSAPDLPVSVSIGDGIDLTDEQIRFNAVALTDSFHTKDDRRIIFYQSGDKAEYIERIIREAGVEARKTARDRAPDVICGKELRSHQTAYEFHMKKPEWAVEDNRSIPTSYFDMSPRQFQVLLDVLIFCDGSIPTKATTSRVFYGRKGICESLQALAVTKGYRATISEYRPNTWRLNLCKTDKCRAKKQNLGYFEGKVFCLTVPSSNFLMRQDNKPSFTGNCQRLQKVLDYEPHLTGHKYGLSFNDFDFNRYYSDVVPYTGSTPGVYNLDGVLFSHYFISGVMGRPIGGVNHAASLLDKNYVSSVCCHSHLFDFAVKKKADGGTIMGLVAGVYQDYDSSWAGSAGNLWHRGLCVLKDFEDGHWDLEWISMARMKKEYGG